MEASNNRNLEFHIRLLGWIHIIGSALFFILGGFIFVFLAGIGFASGDQTAATILSIVGISVGILMVVLAIPELLAGFGLIKGKSWGRMLALVVGILGLFNVPIGTLIGLYTLWVLLPKEAETFFIKAKAA
jgi:hypothetical protein